MLISVISDTHLGYGKDEVEDDSFDHFALALEQNLDSDIIIIPGDIFDSRTPRQETLHRAFSIFQKAREAPDSGVKLAQSIGKSITNMGALKGIPIVAVHGNHESRSEGNVNPVQLLEQAGYLIDLAGGALVFEKNGQKAAIHGMGWVPEQFSAEKIREKGFSRVEGAKNIFVFHQSLEGFVYSDTPDSVLGFGDLPKGFDLYIDGHMHLSHYDPSRRLMVAGSTVITQQKNEESRPKGCYAVKLPEMEVSFREIKGQRPFIYAELEFNKASVSDAVEACRQKVSGLVRGDYGKKPLVRLKLKGTVEKGASASRISVSDIRKGFEESAIISVVNKLESEDLTEVMRQLHQSHSEKMSVDEMGLKTIVEQLKNTGYKGLPVSRILDLLAEGDSERVMSMLDADFSEKYLPSGDVKNA